MYCAFSTCTINIMCIGILSHLPMQAHPQHQPPPTFHPNTIAYPPPVHAPMPIPPPPLSHTDRFLLGGLTLSPSAPSSSIPPTKTLNATSSSSVPKTPDGVALDLEIRTCSGSRWSLRSNWMATPRLLDLLDAETSVYSFLLMWQDGPRRGQVESHQWDALVHLIRIASILLLSSSKQAKHKMIYPVTLIDIFSSGNEVIQQTICVQARENFNRKNRLRRGPTIWGIP